MSVQGNMSVQGTLYANGAMMNHLYCGQNFDYTVPMRIDIFSSNTANYIDFNCNNTILNDYDVRITATTSNNATDGYGQGTLSIDAKKLDTSKITTTVVDSRTVGSYLQIGEANASYTYLGIAGNNVVLNVHLTLNYPTYPLHTANNLGYTYQFRNKTDLANATLFWTSPTVKVSHFIGTIPDGAWLINACIGYYTGSGLLTVSLSSNTNANANSFISISAQFGQTSMVTQYSTGIYIVTEVNPNYIQFTVDAIATRIG